MAQHWCVNFEDDAAFEHGISARLWSMGYQFGDNDSANRKGRIRMNWERAEKVEPGDKFVAYRKTNTFFATGTVRLPRRAKTADDKSDTIEKYLKRREPYENGYIYFDATVVYENFTDDLPGYPVRIDVEAWVNYVPDGVVLPIINKIKVNERHMAVMEIGEDDYNQIVQALVANGGLPPTDRGMADGVTAAVDDAVVEALEVRHAKSQGFLLNSKLRKALEEYAMEAAIRHFRSNGYDVADHHTDYPYDLFCTKTGERLYVEVKGTQTAGKGIILTWNEVEFARRNKDHMALFILHSIKVSPDGKPTSGKEDLRLPWDVDEGLLRPISYIYELP